MRARDCQARAIKQGEIRTEKLLHRSGNAIPEGPRRPEGQNGGCVQVEKWYHFETALSLSLSSFSLSPSLSLSFSLFFIPVHVFYCLVLRGVFTVAKMALSIYVHAGVRSSVAMNCDPVVVL